MEKIINVNNLTYKYEKENVLEDIQFSVPRGAFLGLVGPNGSGKSTLLKIILGLLKLQKGEVELFGTAIEHFKDCAQHKIGPERHKRAAGSGGRASGAG